LVSVAIEGAFHITRTEIKQLSWFAALSVAEKPDNPFMVC
jgi:hypothetical protein